MEYMFNHKSNLSLPRVKWPGCDPWFQHLILCYIYVFIFEKILISALQFPHLRDEANSTYLLLAADWIHAYSAHKEGGTQVGSSE